LLQGNCCIAIAALKPLLSAASKAARDRIEKSAAIKPAGTSGRSSSVADDVYGFLRRERNGRASKVGLALNILLQRDHQGKRAQCSCRISVIMVAAVSRPRP
jgi:hypothetical protein